MDNIYDIITELVGKEYEPNETTYHTPETHTVTVQDTNAQGDTITTTTTDITYFEDIHVVEGVGALDLQWIFAALIVFLAFKTVFKMLYQSMSGVFPKGSRVRYK